MTLEVALNVGKVKLYLMAQGQNGAKFMVLYANVCHKSQA